MINLGTAFLDQRIDRLQTVRRLQRPPQHPDPPRVRRALAAMLDDINRTDVRLFGTGPILRFELAE